MSGNIVGGAATWNLRLDTVYVIKMLLPEAANLEIVNFSDVDSAVADGAAIVDGALATPEGRARVALAAAVGNIPGWSDPRLAPPALDDYLGQVTNQATQIKTSTLGSNARLRADMDQRLGGNISFNVGVDYREQLERLIDRDEVYALYQAAGLDLDADLRTLADAPRIEADPTALNYMLSNLNFNGDLQIPVLTMHTTGDPLVVVQVEAGYADTVRTAGKSGLLHQLFVNRPGHVGFTPAEEITALMMLVNRLDTGRWEDTDTAALNATASGLGPDLNILSVAVPQPTPIQAAFIDFWPAPYLRPWDARCQSGNPVAPLTGDLGPVCL